MRVWLEEEKETITTIRMVIIITINDSKDDSQRANSEVKTTSLDRQDNSTKRGRR